MLSNLGNFVLLLGIFLSFAIIYVSSQNLKTEGLKINKAFIICLYSKAL